MISVIIPSIKEKILTEKCLLSCPVLYEVIVSRKAGIGYARNWGAKQAKGSILVFVDDDLRFSSEVWNRILSIRRGEFVMTQGDAFPITRIMSIYAEDFWAVNGFDESYTVGGEDTDFYFRAIEKGLKCKELPANQIVHAHHVKRAKNIHVALLLCSANMKGLIKYGVKYPKIFRVEFLDRLKRLQVRTVLIQFMFLLYYLFSKKIDKRHQSYIKFGRRLKHA